eukprot:TRINITY_DN6591_c0_g1_i1.p1 TRINITY_DN6591_c0_g1~~TRINITY_DN6591_c0_g1_i1.p1  ORF type:complete len:753 (+),score=140.20 TRINITY_DN6591_c0_g1_i1:1985-4243(+)
MPAARRKWKNPFAYEMHPGTQEELMAVVHPLNPTHHRTKGQTEAQVRWSKFKNQNNIWTWLFLTIAGFMITLFLVCIDLIIRDGFFALRTNILEKAGTHTAGYFLQYLSFIVWTCVLGLASAFIVKKLCYAASGSGVPDLKSIYCGFYKPEPLAPKVFIFKSIALMFSYGSGLSVGKEGPYVHLAAVMANILLMIPPFGKLVAPNETRRCHLIAACSALGIAATFGSPIGGVLFGIEVMAVYYLNVNYWRSFYAAAVGAVAVKIVLSDPSQTVLESFNTHLPTIALDTVEIFAFVLIGILTGFLGSLFIWLYERTVAWKKKHQAQLAKLTWAGEVFLVALVTGIISFPLYYLRLDHAAACNSLFTNNDIEQWYIQMYPDAPEYTPQFVEPRVSGAILIATMIYTAVKLCLTVLSITLPIPYGIYIPLFAIGAAFGRGFGEGMLLLSNWFDPHKRTGITIIPRGYAAVGAAALCGGATRTVSSAVIILELTNDLNYFIPVLLAVAISCGIGNMLNHSIYDVFVRLKGLPYLPFLRVKGDSTVAHDIMDRKLFYVTQKTTLAKLQHLLSTYADFTFPVVDSEERLYLIGSITRPIVERIVDFCKEVDSLRVDDNAQESLLYEEEGAIALQQRSVRRSVTNPEITEDSDTSETSSNSINSSGLGAGRSGAVLLSNVPGHEGDEGTLDLMVFALSHPWVEIDPAPFSVVESTPIRKVLFMFTMLTGSVLWVTYKGKLVGSITKQNLAKTLSPKIDH